MPKSLRLLAATLAAFVVSCGAAHADPISATILALGGAFSSASAAVAGAWAAASAATGLAGVAFNVFTQLAGGLVLGALSRAIAPRQKRTVSSGTRVSMTFGETNPASFVMGLGCTPGELLYHNSWDRAGNNTPNEYYVQVIELSDLPSRLERVFINGEWATLKPAETVGDVAGHNPVEGYTVDGYECLWVRFYDGTQTAADPYLVAKFGAHPDRPWTADMVGLGMTYAIVTARLKQINRQKPECKFQIQAWGHYDRRKDSTAGGVGAQRWGDWTTWAPSRNPVVLIDNILRGIHDPINGELIWGGQGITNYHLPASTWFAAMNACDAVRTTSGGDEPEYRAGIEVLVSDEPADLVDELLKACSGQVAEMAGQWHIKVGPPGPAVYDFTDADVILTSPDTFKPIRPLDALYNGIAGQYVDPAAGWVAKDAPLRINDAYIAEDGGKQNIADVSYPSVPYPGQVQRLMLTALKDERRQRAHSLPMPPECVALGPLDDVSYSSVENGYDTKKFAVEMVEDLPDGNVAIAIRERDPSDYDYSILDELPTAIGYRPHLPRPPQLVDFSVEPWTIADAEGRPRTPAIRLNWTVRTGVTGIRYMVRNEETLALVQTEGRASKKPPEDDGGFLVANGNPVVANAAPVSYQVINDPTAGYAILSGEAIKAVTEYGVNCMYEPADQGRAWSGWLTVTTPNVRLILDDFADEVTDVITDARDAADAAAAEAREALAKANEVSDLIGGISAELISDIEDIVDQLAGISTGDIQEIRGIAMAGLRKGGWAVDPTFDEWTPGGTSTPVHYTTANFGTYATRQVSATNAPFLTSALIDVPAGDNGPVLVRCSSDGTDNTKGADPAAEYVVLEALIRGISGTLTDCRLRVEWHSTATSTWVAGHAFDIQNCTGRMVTDWGYSVDPNVVQSKVVIWQRPVTADAVRLVLIVKAAGQTNATVLRIDYLNFGPATEAEVKALLANGYADAAVNAYQIEIEGPTGAIAALGSTLRTEFGDADADITDSLFVLTNDVESIAAALTVVETQFGGTNLVKNPQFSDGVKAVGVAPANWTDWDAGMTVAQKTAPGVGAGALQGAPTRYVAVFPSNDWVHDLRAHRPVPIRAGERIEVSGQFAASSAATGKAVTLWVRFYDTNGDVVSSVFPPALSLTGGATWVTMTPPVLTAPAGAATFSLYVRELAGGSSTPVYFTNAQSRIVDNASYSSAQVALASASTATSTVATWQASVEAHFDDMDAMVSATATAYATASYAASAYVVKFLNGAFKLVGWNETDGSGSAIVLDADNVIAPGTLSTGSLVVTDLGYNKVPDDQLQSAVSWTRNDAGWSLLRVATSASAQSVGEVRWTKANYGGSVDPVTFRGPAFSVKPGQRLECSYQGATNGTGRIYGGGRLQFLDRELNFISIVYAPGLLDTTGGIQKLTGRVVVPSGAYQARWYWSLDPDLTTTPVARLFAPSVISNEDASVLITPDGAFFDQLTAQTAWIGTANIIDASVSTLKIQGGAVTIPVYSLADGSIALTNVDQTVATLVINRSVGFETRLGFSCQYDGPSGGDAYIVFTVKRGSTTVRGAHQGRSAAQNSFSYVCIDDNLGGGTTTYTVQARRELSVIGGNVYQRFMEAHQFKR
jgi:hypothetical protein